MTEIERIAAGETADGGAVLELRNVSRSFEDAGGTLTVLQGVNLSLMPGQVTALVGPSGAGKSTLLHIAGLLEAPTGGEVLFQGQDCGDASDWERTLIRRDGIGFVYQFHHLLPEFSALENVMMPQLIAGLSRREAKERARQLLNLVGLEERETHRPAKLSGGEQQRVAIVRSIANVPAVLLADEPTGNLDPHTAEEVFRQLRRIISATRIAALIATHNHELARAMDRVVELRDGTLHEIK
ncbi:ABC transporter ATP-binding protein [Nisaea acidiphila]